MYNIIYNYSYFGRDPPSSDNILYNLDAMYDKTINIIKDNSLMYDFIFYGANDDLNAKQIDRESKLLFSIDGKYKRNKLISANQLSNELYINIMGHVSVYKKKITHSSCERKYTIKSSEHIVIFKSVNLNYDCGINFVKNIFPDIFTQRTNSICMFLMCHKLFKRDKQKYFRYQMFTKPISMIIGKLMFDDLKYVINDLINKLSTFEMSSCISEFNIGDKKCVYVR